MREIKFRQPITNSDDKFSGWHYWGFIDGVFVAPAGYGISNKETADQSQQYTELKDGNGQEIYGGDILQFIDEKMKVFFNKYTACFDVEFIAGGCGECEPLVNGEWDEEDVEVIGNVYQNPELLEAEGVEE